MSYGNWKSRNAIDKVTCICYNEAMTMASSFPVLSENGSWECQPLMAIDNKTDVAELDAPNRLRGAACYLAGPMTDCADLGIG